MYLRLLRVEARDAGVRVVGRPEAPFRLELLVVVVDALDLERRQQATVLVGERDDVALRRLVDREADGQRPGQAAGEVHVLGHREVVLAIHEALERRERAAREHVEVGDLARRQRDHLERVDAVRPVARRSTRRPPCGLIKRSAAVTRCHAATSEPTRPSSSSFATMRRALSSGSCASVSITISASSGTSYGSSTPVKPLISPANAFA